MTTPINQASLTRELGLLKRRVRALEANPVITILPDNALDAVINVSASGTTDLVAAPGAGKKIKVIGCTLIAADVVKVKFLDSTPTDKTGAMQLIGSTGFASIAFICASNKKLQINLDVAVQVSGVVNYLIING